MSARVLALPLLVFPCPLYHCLLSAPTMVCACLGSSIAAGGLNPHPPKSLPSLRVKHHPANTPYPSDEDDS